MSTRPEMGGSRAMTEMQLVDRLTSFLRSEGYRVRREVPNMGQVADVVATRGRWVTFVEAKLSRWDRAMRQCQAHEHVADYICIAVAAGQVSERLHERAVERGYGILIHEPPRDSFQWALRPRVNRTVWMPQRVEWARQARVIAHAD